jgi:PAS domain S-box-containing protein
MFEFFPQTILLIDKNNTILDANEQIKEWLGFEPNEILETNLLNAPFLSKKSKKNCRKEFF